MMNRVIRRVVLSFAGILGLSFGVDAALAAPVAPDAPIAGYLYDETYVNEFTQVTDSFGGLHGFTSSDSNEEAVDNPDTPFSYTGNRSLEIPANFQAGVSFTANTFNPVLNGSAAVSFQAWVKYEDGTLSAGLGNRIADIKLNTTGLHVSINNDNTVTVGGRSQNTDSFQQFKSTATLTPGEWNHVVGVLDYANNQIRIALNGGAFETGAVLFGANAWTSAATAPTQADLMPVHGSAANTYNGLIDEAAIWNTVLTADNVEWLSQNSLRLMVPEPASTMMVGVGAIAVLWRRRQR